MTSKQTPLEPSASSGRKPSLKTAIIMLIVGVLLLLASTVLWWRYVHQNPENVFKGMIEQSLATKGVTVQSSQQQEGDSVRQYIQYEMGAVNMAHSYTVIKQSGTEVKTEAIATPKVDYTRYVDVKTDQKATNGKPLNFSKILNVWSRSEDKAQTETQASGNQLFSQAALGVGLSLGNVPVPHADLSHAQREKLLKEINQDNLYDVSYADVKKERKDGRLQYTYKVKVQTLLYVRYMKNFAKEVGLHDLDSVDPNDYQASKPLEFTLVVDANSRRLVSASSNTGQPVQYYSGHGIPVNVTEPKKFITSDKLQELLNAVLAG